MRRGYVHLGNETFPDVMVLSNFYCPVSPVLSNRERTTNKIEARGQQTRSISEKIKDFLQALDDKVPIVILSRHRFPREWFK